MVDLRGSRQIQRKPKEAKGSLRKGVVSKFEKIAPNRQGQNKSEKAAKQQQQKQAET